jgi:hypothetical protein
MGLLYLLPFTNTRWDVRGTAQLVWYSPAPILSQMTPVHTYIHTSPKVNFNNILPLTPIRLYGVCSLKFERVQ